MEVKTNIEELLKTIDQQLLVKFLDALVKEQLPEVATSTKKETQTGV